MVRGFSAGPIARTMPSGRTFRAVHPAISPCPPAKFGPAAPSALLGRQEWSRAWPGVFGFRRAMHNRTDAYAERSRGGSETTSPMTPTRCRESGAWRWRSPRTLCSIFRRRSRRERWRYQVQANFQRSCGQIEGWRGIHAVPSAFFLRHADRPPVDEPPVHWRPATVAPQKALHVGIRPPSAVPDRPWRNKGAMPERPVDGAQSPAKRDRHEGATGGIDNERVLKLDPREYVVLVLFEAVPPARDPAHGLLPCQKEIAQDDVDFIVARGWQNRRSHQRPRFAHCG
jgi:hypothetical protein